MTRMIVLEHQAILLGFKTHMTMGRHNKKTNEKKQYKTAMTWSLLLVTRFPAKPESKPGIN